MFTESLVVQVIVDLKHNIEIGANLVDLWQDSEATRKVIGSCGGLRTAQAFMLSGIGTAAELCSFGVPVVVVIADLLAGRELHDYVSRILF